MFNRRRLYAIPHHVMINRSRVSIKNVTIKAESVSFRELFAGRKLLKLR